MQKLPEQGFNGVWSTIRPEMQDLPHNPPVAPIHDIEIAYSIERSRNKLKYSLEAAESLLLARLMKDGELDIFLNTKKGSPECNARLNKKANRFRLAGTNFGQRRLLDLYNEFQEKIIQISDGSQVLH